MRTDVLRTDVRPSPVAAPPPAEQVTDTPAGSSVVGALAAALAGSPAAHGIPAPTVHPLGLRDELAVPGGDEPGAVHVYGHHALVGPFAPGGGPACARCLARRWQAVRGRGLREALESGTGTRAAGASPWQLPFSADALAAVLAAHTAAAAGTAGERFPYAYLLDLETMGVTRFPVAPDAECPACGDTPPDTAPAASVALPVTPKRSVTDFRSRPADAYDVPLEVFVNPVAGMLGPSVVPDLVSASTSSTVGSFLLRSGDYLRECFWGGHTPATAPASGSACSKGWSASRGCGRAASAPRSSRRTTNSPAPHRCSTPARAACTTPASTARSPGCARSIRRGRSRGCGATRCATCHPLLVPEITAYYHAPGGLANRFVQESSNGCASGGSWTEAVYFGLMEVIERDAFLLAWYGRAPLTEIDGSASRRPETRSMIDRLAMYGYRARFFDTRITFPVPVVTAVAERVDGGTGRLCFGAGASLDPEAALAAGLCEIATDAVNLRARTERDAPRLRAMAEDFTKVRVLHDHPLVYGLPEMARHADFLLGASGRPGNRRPPRITPAALARDTVAPGDDLRDDVEACVAQVARAGFDVIAVDQTGPEQRALGFRTAGVIVPGLLPIDFGWNRQRARHMPRMRSALREAGLCERDLEADDLNPAPHPFP